MIRLRKFNLSDLDRATEIRQVSLPDPWPKSRFEKMYSRYPENFIVAENEERVIGYIIGGIKNDSGRIISLAVDPDWRKRGIGTNFADTLINQSKEKRVREMPVHVRTWNKEALNFYTNLGFKIIERIENYYPNGNDAYLMKKRI